MENKINIDIRSEIGNLEGVILHTPGAEIENMTPTSAQRALYSDILNLQVAAKEYAQLSGVLEMITNVYQVRELLTDILKMDKVKETIVREVCNTENAYNQIDRLLSIEAHELSRLLIEGVPLLKDTLTKYLSPYDYALDPLHNFFFTRDASSSVFDSVLINKMANQIRAREAIIMEAIFDYHPYFITQTINPHKITGSSPEITMEGGDIQIANHDTLVLGMGMRTTSQGIDFIANQLGKNNQLKNIIVQELPKHPESFIHLDMVFTFLDMDKCMVYEPLILKENAYKTYHIELENGKAKKITEEKNILHALKKQGMDLEPLYCGGKKNTTIQAREQWHSGANFFAVGPGKVFGYERNVHTIEELDKAGFSILNAHKILTREIDINDYKKYAVTIDGSELARGGGGCRCMTMPIKRQRISNVQPKFNL